MLEWMYSISELAFSFASLPICEHTISYICQGSAPSQLNIEPTQTDYSEIRSAACSAGERRITCCSVHHASSVALLHVASMLHTPDTTRYAMLRMAGCNSSALCELPILASKRKTCRNIGTQSVQSVSASPSIRKFTCTYNMPAVSTQPQSEPLNICLSERAHRKEVSKARSPQWRRKLALTCSHTLLFTCTRPPRGLQVPIRSASASASASGLAVSSCKKLQLTSSMSTISMSFALPFALPFSSVASRSKSSTDGIGTLNFAYFD